MVNILKSGVISSNNLLENDLYGIQGTITKQLNNNLITGNAVVYTDKNGTISKTDNLGGIEPDVLKTLAGKTLIVSYDVYTPGYRYSEETGQSSVWNKVRYGIHGACYIDGNVQYPFTKYLGGSSTPIRCIMTWTVPSGETYTRLGFAVQDFDKPASTNDSVWYMKNFKLEIDSVTPYTPSDYTGTGDSLVFKEFLEI